MRIWTAPQSHSSRKADQLAPHRIGHREHRIPITITIIKAYQNSGTPLKSQPDVSRFPTEENRINPSRDLASVCSFKPSISCSHDGQARPQWLHASMNSELTAIQRCLNYGIHFRVVV